MKEITVDSIEDIDLYLNKNIEGEKHAHTPEVNESGVIECTECRKMFITDLDKKELKQIFNEQYGEFGKEKLKNLMTIKKMVMKGDIKNLQPKLYGYEDDKTKLNISRVFYEQK